MTPIRPNAFPTQPPQTAAAQGADAARAAAQRAFFDAAMGRANAPAASAAPQAPAFTPTAAAAAPAQIRPAQTPAEAPSKILRPGSLLDIRV
ncbi:MAG: hypothetical protein JSR98_00030 [Proteobacteria bacterium]|nr:hypothetical protein [Pseudomonadota bacterium]